MEEKRTSSIQTARSAPGHRHYHALGQRGVLGEWELVELLGEGQWSRVYSARPRDCAEQWPADYALKVAALDPERRRQAAGLLACEALVGRAVEHPHLVSVLAADLQSTPPYLVMPLMQGVTLDRVVAAPAPLRTPHALWIVRQVAEALAALHAAGWIHADVKPANVSLTAQGHATLIDLGFALRLGSRECAPGGSLRGSPTYTAPEMISAAMPVTDRCDIYSLGILLFELLTGQPPFVFDQPGPLMLAHLQQPVPRVRQRVPSLPRGVCELVQSLLAKEPLRRPAATELMDRLVDLEIATLAERAA